MIINVAEAMADRGHECVLYAYASPASEVTYSNSDKVRFVDGTPYAKSRLFRHFLKIKEIRKTIKTVNPDLIVSFLPYPNILTILAKRGLGKKIVISERGDPAVYGGFIKLFGHGIMRRADGAVFQTEGARSFYRKKLYDKSVVIPNAITIEKAPRVSLENRRNEIACVGRFDIKQKRQDLAVEAFAVLAREYPDLQLVFYGDGPDMQNIQDMVQKRGLTERVRFAGKVSGIENYVKSARAYLLTSDYEGIPNSLIEAMCVGIPCVSTDCTPGGARLLIEHEKNGLLVSRGNVEELVQACKKILDNPEYGEELGERAQGVCDDFSPKIIYSKWEEYLERVCDDINKKRG